MRPYRILIANGPNLGHLGNRQPEIYGTRGLAEIPALVQKTLGTRADEVTLEFFQSNSEGAIIDRLEKAREEGVDGIALNAGAYTHTSLAIADCLAWIKVPCVEVHLSNIWARSEPIRQQSFIGSNCIGVVAGFGLMSYALAVQALLNNIDEIKP